MADTKLNWGILGTGGIARVLADAINASTTGTLVAVGSRSQESADAFGEKYKVPKRYASYEALLADKQVEAVYISLPNHLHAEWTIRCAQAGKHILNEKPFSLNQYEAMAMLEACRQHNVFQMEAFMYRCHPQTAKIVELIKNKTIGDVRVIQSNFAWNMGERNLANIRMQNPAGGGALMDVGAYTLSMSRLIAGAALGLNGPAEPLEFKAVAEIGAQSRIDEYATATLKFPGGILATLACGMMVNIGNPVAVWGSKGHLTVANPWFPGNDPKSAEIHLHVDGKTEIISAPSTVPLYVHEVDTVAKHIKDKQAPTPCMTWSDSLHQMKALDRWRKEVGLVFDPELPDNLTRTVSGQPLKPRPGHNMTYGKIEGVNKPVSRFVIGTMVFRDNQPYTNALLDYFVESGGTAIDTALVYGSEAVIGKWINLRGNREQIVLIAKGAASMEATPAMIDEHLNKSIDTMKQSYFDAWLMHRDNVNVPVGEFVDCLNRHVKAGRIRTFGGSNWTTERLQAANDYAKKNNLMGFNSSSPNFTLADWNEPMWGGCVKAVDPASRAWYQKTHLPLLAWSSQANAFFTGMYSEKEKDSPKVNQDIRRVWFNDANFKRLARVKELAARKNVSMTALSLAYVLNQPLNIFALIGPATFEEYRTSAEALDVKLTPDELAWLNLEK